MIIKTPTGLVQVDKASKVLTQAEYDALPEYKRNEGTYYITDSTDESDYIGDILTLVGIVGDTDISYMEDGTLTTITSILYKNKADQADVSQIKTDLEILKDLVNGSGTDIKIIGNSDISKIADGTLTGAIVYLNNNIISREVFDALSGKVNTAIASIENKADISDLRSVLIKAEQNESDIHNLSITKANQSSIDDLQRLITGNSNNIAILLKNKADISELAIIADKVSNNVTLISGLSTNKANQSEVDAIVIEIAKIKQQIQNGGGGTGGGGNYDEIIGVADISDIGDGTLTGGLRKVFDTKVSKTDLTTALATKADTETVALITSHLTEIDNSIYTMGFDISVLQSNKADLVYVNAKVDALNTKIEAMHWNPGDADISRIGDGTITGAILYNYEYKADRTELEPIKRDVLSNATAITALNDSKADRGDIDKFVTELGNKATKVELNALKNIVEENALVVKQKANQTDFEALDKKVQTNISDIAFLYANKVDRSEIEDLITDFTNLATRAELNNAVVTINNKILEVRDIIGRDDISELGPNHTSAILKLDYMKASRASVEDLTTNVTALQTLADGTRSDLDTVMSKVDDMYDEIGQKYNIGDTWIGDIGDGTVTGAIRKTYDIKADKVTVQRLTDSVDMFFDALTYKADTYEVDNKFALVNEAIGIINGILPLKADKTELEPIKEDLTEIHEDIKALGVDGIKETLNSKADKTVVDAIDQRLVNAEEAISTKAEKVDLEALETKHANLETIVSGQANLIQENTDAIKTKLDKVELESVNTAITSLIGRVSTNETNIATNTNVIKTKADKTALEATNTSFSNLTARVDSAEELVEDIESRVNTNTTKINRIDESIGDPLYLEGSTTIVDAILSLQQNKADNDVVMNLTTIVNTNKTDIKTIQDKIKDITESDLSILGDTDISDIGDGTLTGGLRKTFDIKANKLEVDTAIGNLQGSIDSANQSIETLQTEVGKKADKTIVDTLSTTVGSHTTAISDIENTIDNIIEDIDDLDLRLGVEDISAIGDSITNAILVLQNTKLSNADLETIRKTLDEHTTKITANIAAIATKANQTDLEITNKNISDNTIAINTNIEDIATLKTTKANQVDLEATNKNVSDLALLIEQKANISDVNDTVEEINTKIAENKTAIEQNTSDIEIINEIIDSVSGDITDLTELIDTKADKSELELTNKSIADLSKVVDEKTDKTYVDGKVTELDTKITTNTEKIAEHTTDLAGIHTSITDIDGDLSDLTTLVGTKANQVDLELTNKSIADLKLDTDKKADKTYVDAQDAALDTKIATNKTNIENNAKDITTANTAIQKNKTDIANLDTNKADKTALDETNANIINLSKEVDKKAAITYVDGKVTELDTKISHNTDLINTNTAAIAQNTEDITTINGVIDSVSGDILDLTELIDTKADKSELELTNKSIADLKLDTDKKADKTYVDGKVLDLNTKIETNAGNIEKNKTDIIAINTTIVGLEDDIQDNATQIAALDASKADKTALAQTNTKLTNLESKVDLKADITYVDNSVSEVTTLAENNAKDIITANTAITTNASDITNLKLVKADKSALDETNTALTTLETKVDTKADKTYVEEQDTILSERLDEHETRITQNASDITAINAIIDTVSGDITDLTELIDTKADKSELELTNKSIADLSKVVDEKTDKTYVDTQDAALSTRIDINKTDLVTANTAIQKNKIDISNLDTNKADKTALDETNTAVTNLTIEVNKKTDKTYVDGKISELSTDIENNAKDIVTANTAIAKNTVDISNLDTNKADKTALDETNTNLENLDARVATAEINIGTINTKIQTLDDTKVNYSDLDPILDDINTLETRLDNLDTDLALDHEMLLAHETSIINLQETKAEKSQLNDAVAKIGKNTTDIAANKTAIETNTTAITNLGNSKADRTELDAIVEDINALDIRVTTTQSDLEALDKRVVKNTADIATKANQSDLNLTNTNMTNLTTRVTTAEGKIATNTTEIAKKANQSDLNTTNTNLTNLDKRVVTNANNITALQNNKADKTALAETNTNITNLDTRVTTAESDIVTLKDTVKDITPPIINIGTHEAVDFQNSWFKVCEYLLPHTFADYYVLFAVSRDASNSSVGGMQGFLSIHIRDNSNISPKITKFKWLVNSGFNPADFVVYLDDTKWGLYAKTDRAGHYTKFKVINAANQSGSNINLIYNAYNRIPEEITPTPVTASAPATIEASNVALNTIAGLSASDAQTAIKELYTNKAEKSALATTNTNVANLDTRVTTAEGKLVSLQESIDELGDLIDLSIIGDTDISSIGDGTLTGAVAKLNDTKASKTDLNTTNTNVTNLTTRVTTAEGNITTNKNNITGLTTRIGTAETNITNLTANKAEKVHKHVVKDITDFPTSMPASDVYAWAKQPNKPTYTATEVGADTAGSADAALALAKTYVNTEISDLINGAPETLDTLKEIADVLTGNSEIIDNINDAILKKADKVVVEALTVRVETNETNIATLTDTKAEKSALNTTNTNVTNLTTRVTTAETNITTLTNNKADKSTVNGINTRLGTAETNITNLQNTKLDKTEIVDITDNLTDLNTRVSTAETNITTLNTNKADKTALDETNTNLENLDARVSTAEGNITTLTNNKADKSTVTAMNTRLTTAETNIDTNTTDIIDLNKRVNKNAADIAAITTDFDSKADQADLEALDGRVVALETLTTTHTTDITSLKNNKADKSTVTAMNTRLNTAESNINTNTTDIETLKATKLDKADITEITNNIIDLDKRVVKNTADIATLNTTKANQSDLNITNTNITNLTTRVTTVETNLTGHIDNKNLHVPTLETLNNARYLGNDGNWRTITPSYIGLGNVDNTRDKDKIVNMARSLPFGVASASNAKTYTTSIAQITAYSNGVTILIQFDSTPIANATLNINSLGVIPIIYASNDTGANFIQGAIYEFVYTNNKFMAIHSINTDRVMEIKANGTTEIPLLGADRALTDLPSGDSTYTTTGVVTNKITMNPSTGALKATTFNGELVGNAASATKLKTARTITLAGGVTGSGTFDGSTNITINTTVGPHIHSEYLPLTGGTMTGQITSTSALILDTNINGNGIALHQNETQLNLLLKEIGGGASNTYTLNPLSVNLTTGRINMNQGLTVTSWLNTDRLVVDNSTIFVTEGYTENYTMGDLFNTSNKSGIKRSLIKFISAVGSSNNDAAIYHETSSLTADIGKSVLHLSPSGDNNDTDYISIHGTNQAETIKLYTSGNIITTGDIKANAFVGNLTGNANTADKLKTARAITLTGGVTGSGSFDGSSNLTINTTMAPHTHSEYLPLAGGTMTGTIRSTKNYILDTNIAGSGVILYQNDSDFYIMLKDIGDGNNSTYNSLRPFRINLSTGKVMIGQGLAVTNKLSADRIGINNDSIVLSTSDYDPAITMANVFNTSDTSGIKRTIIRFAPAAGSSDTGFIYHETSSLAEDSNKGVLHLSPSDDSNNETDYISIHAFNKPETIKLYTGGNIWTSGVITATELIGNLTGNASTADKLKTSRTISLTGSITGSGSFDGSSNLTIHTTIADGSGLPYLPLAGGTMSGTIVGTTAKFLRTNINDNGVIFQQNNAWFNILLTDIGAGATGNYNSLRPFAVQLSNGSVTMSNGVTINNGLVINSGNLIVNTRINTKFINVDDSIELSSGGYTAAQTMSDVFNADDTSGIKRSYIKFWSATGSNDNGMIYHETSGLDADKDKGVLHLCPADGKHNSTDYVSIHGYNAEERLKLYTGGSIYASDRVTATEFAGELIGNAASATKLKTARTITLTGGVAGSGSFDGSSNLTINTTMAPHTHSEYLQLSGGTMTGTITSSVTTQDRIAGFKGKAIINSTPTNPNYIMLAAMSTSNGVFTTGVWSNRFQVLYATNELIAAGINDQTAKVELMDEAGNSKFNNVTATTFIGELTGNAASATKLKTARTITLTGGVTGSGTFDGSSNLTINTTMASHTHSEYLPIDGSGTMTGALNSNVASDTILAGLRGNAILNYTGYNYKSYITIANVKTLGNTYNMSIDNMNGKFMVGYASNNNIDAGVNSYTNSVTLIDNIGRSTFNDITATTFRGTLAGNADSATKLKTARTITLVGGVTGSGSFDGSFNLTIDTTVGPHTHSEYLPLSGGTMTGTIVSSVATYTVPSAFSGVNMLKSTADKTADIMIASIPSPNGVFAIGKGASAVYGKNAFTLIYGTNASIEAGDYMPTKSIMLLDENGDSKFNNVIATTLNGELTGNASTATKLKTARTITLTGDATGSTSFDGSGNVNLAVTVSIGNALSKYLPLAGGTMTGVITSNVASNSQLAAYRGTAVIQTTAKTNYVGLASMPTKNGVYILGTYTDFDQFDLCYATNTQISSGDTSAAKWITLLDANGNTDFDNIVSAKTFKGNLTGNVAGNADTASKWKNPITLTLSGGVTGSASIDGSNNITLFTTIGTHYHPEYLPTYGGTMTGAITFKSAYGYNFLRTNFENNGLMFNQSGSTFSIYLSDIGKADDGTYNSLRPFAINMSTGRVAMKNGLDITGGATVYNGFMVSGNTTFNGKISVPSGIMNDIGDDVQIGDTDQGGHLGIMAKPAATKPTGIEFYKKGTVNPSGKMADSASLDWDGTKLSMDKPVSVPELKIGDAVSLVYDTINKCLNFNFA